MPTTTTTTTSSADLPARIRAEFTELVRYGQAQDICERFGVRERTFRKLLETGQVPKRKFPGDARSYYSRETLISLLSAATTPHTTP